MGSWTLALEGPARATAGEPLTFRVSARGLGDISSLPAPAPAFPVAWKVFPPSTSETPGTKGGRVGGTRTWEFVAVPSDAGAVTIAPVELRVFDPQAARYGTVKSAPFRVQIVAAPASKASVEEVRPPPPQPIAAAKFWSRVAPASLAVLAVLAALAGLLVVLRRHARPAAPSPGGERLEEARRELEAARALCASEQAKAFFETLAQALNHLAASLGDRDAASEDPAAIAARLKRAGVAAPVCETLARAVEGCRRFAFLHSSDGAILRRSLALAEEAFGAAS